MKAHPPRRAGFTTVELLVVIGIIVLLISILLPVVGRIQQTAKATNTAAFIAQLSTAIEAYHADFRAYPGPLSNDEIRRNGFGNQPAGASYRRFEFANNVAGFRNADNNSNQTKITMSENLVLGLLGGLRPVISGGTIDVVYDPSLVGKGPMSLNPAQPKPYAPYVEAINLSWQDVGGEKTGAFFDEASIGADASNPTGADDSIIPEFVDRYTDPMPILYLRAKVGASGRFNTATDNPVVTNVPDPNTNPVGRGGAYDISQIIGYTQPPAGGTPIGVGKKLPTYASAGPVATPPNPGNGEPHHGLRSVNPLVTTQNPPESGTGYLYPYDAFPYLRDPSLSTAQTTSPNTRQVPRQKDRFILISAGADRIYGTNDDITSFGAVVP